ncbi:MAG: radical SAM protein [Candidatus Margulisiibacteriota bacterium]
MGNRELREKIEKAYKILENCTLCPRECKVNRLKGELGDCKVGKDPMLSSASPHFGEEAPLVGRHGSGTIFLTGCNLHCLYCQNYEISHSMMGKVVSIEEFADQMLYLQKLGCHNINFVTPSHQVPQILAALEIAIPQGLKVPLVYNTGGYDSIQELKLMEDVIDIYMPDFKYWDKEVASSYSKEAKDYPEVARAAFKEMHRQVGDLIMNKEGIAERGMLIRHLVLPGGLAGTGSVMHFIASELSKDSYVNIMDQYRPCGQAWDFPPLDRRISHEEYREAIDMAKKEGLHRGFPRI